MGSRRVSGLRLEFSGGEKLDKILENAGHGPGFAKLPEMDSSRKAGLFIHYEGFHCSLNPAHKIR